MAVQFFEKVALAEGEFDWSALGQGGTIVHVGSSDPAPISEDAEGAAMLPGSRRVVATTGLIPGFWSQDDSHYLDWLADNGTRVPLFSPEGSAQAAQAAQEAVETLRGQVTDFINTGGRLHILGTLDSADQLPPEPNAETDAWLIDGDLWAWTEANGWTNTGPVRGPEGPAGRAGASDWDDVENKPDVFAPAAHKHPAGDITGTLDAARIPALPYRGQNWTPTAEQVQGLDEHVADLAPVVLLDEVELTGNANPGEALTIPPALRGQFAKYVLDVTAADATLSGHDFRPLVVRINRDSDPNYRVSAELRTVTDVVHFQLLAETAHPRTGWVGPRLGTVQIVFTPHRAGQVSWSTTGYATSTGTGAYITGGGEWTGTGDLEFFQVATTTSSNQWAPGSYARLWGYR